MKQKLIQEEIVPDVIDDIPESPNVTVEYPSGVSVTYGNELTPTQVKDVPTVDWPAKDDELYMVAMVDPDAPSRKEPRFRHWLHWLVVNIPGKDMSKGETIAEYVGSGPPEGSGLHRYVFLVYAQKDHRIHTSLKLTNTSAAGRASFSIREFAGQHHSKPVAGRFTSDQ